MKLNFYKLIILLILLAISDSCYGFLELVVPSVGAVLSYYYDKVICYNGRCCSNVQIPANFYILEQTLKKEVFGQPLVIDTTLKALKSHWNGVHKPKKALTLSFHGGPGVGKNYVSKFIEEALYLGGPKDNNVHHFVARLDFPEPELVPEYKKNLVEWIKGNVTRCPRQLFVFDEVNNMPPGILDAIKPFIDYHGHLNRVDYREAIYIFLSNTGSKVLNQHTYDLWKEGIRRDDLKLKNFEKLISSGSFNEEGGFYHSETISGNLIDHYIPFLPLMEPHIRLCIEAEFRKHGKQHPTEEEFQEVLGFIDWGPKDIDLFSKTGCKRISQKVGLLAY